MEEKAKSNKKKYLLFPILMITLALYVISDLRDSETTRYIEDNRAFLDKQLGNWKIISKDTSPCNPFPIILAKKCTDWVLEYIDKSGNPRNIWINYSELKDESNDIRYNIYENVMHGAEEILEELLVDKFGEKYLKMCHI